MEINSIEQWDESYPNKEILKHDIDKCEMYIGEIENQIVTAFVLNQECEEEYKIANWKYNDISFYIIHRLCVNPTFQNKGLGAKTMNYIEVTLSNAGIGAIRLDVFSHNPVALKLYEKLGFEKVGTANWRKGMFYLLEKRI